LTLLHVPTVPDRLHAWHCPPQRPSQQTLSTQNPSRQSVSTLQVEPPLSLPQLLLRQGWPSQSAVTVHVRAHAVSPVLHRNGAHDSAVPGTHAPIPSQRDSVSVLAVGSQVAALQSWPSA
jgi:hypothetical protein